jgi:hypothetical protein
MAKKIIRSDENPFWIGCEWTGVFTYYDHHHNSVDPYMFKQGAEAFTATQNFVANKAGWFLY